MPRESKFSGGLGFWLALAVVVAVLMEGAVAFANVGDCEGLDRHWRIFPPEWVCERPQP